MDYKLSRGFLRFPVIAMESLRGLKTNMRELFRKYLDNNCSPDEVKRLLAYFNVAENEIMLRRLIIEWLEENDEEEEESQWQTNFYRAGGLIKKLLNIETFNVVDIFKKAKFQVAAAASTIHLRLGFNRNRRQLD